MMIIMMIMIIIIIIIRELGMSSFSKLRPGYLVVAICYWLERLGIECLWGDIFRTSPDRTCSPPSFLGTGAFP